MFNARLPSSGISISYTRVFKLSTVLGNDILRQYEEHKVVCSPSLRKNIFTATAIDKSSTSAGNLFAGTGISLFQHITEKKPGEVQHEKSTQSSSKTLRHLQNIYTDITQPSTVNKWQLLYFSEQCNIWNCYILKWFVFLPRAPFQPCEILHRVFNSELTTSRSMMPLLPKLKDINNYSASIERFVVVLYDCNNAISVVNECR